MNLLRRIPADFLAGVRALKDLLLWGHIYPRHCPVRVPTAPSDTPGSGT